MLGHVARGGGYSAENGVQLGGIVIGEFSLETREPKLYKLVVFWANYCKIVFFSFKNVILMGGKLGKKW